MNVHLIRTNDYALEDLREVHELLTHSGGPLYFIVHDDPVDVHSLIFQEAPSLKENSADLKALTFKQLFGICQHF